MCRISRIICIPGRRDDLRDSYWYDTVTGKRVPQPACIKRVADKLRMRAKRRAARAGASK